MSDSISGRGMAHHIPEADKVVQQREERQLSLARSLEKLGVGRTGLNKAGINEAEGRFEEHS